MEINKEWIAQQRAICDAATPGPWEWNIAPDINQCKLQTSNNGKRYVMGFARWGMKDAAPVFQKDFHMQRADVFAKSIPGLEHHEGYDDYIDHPDALFIAAARTALPAALDALEAAQAESEEWKRDYGSAIELLAEKKKQIDALTAERDAAARDLKWLSNEYKFCVTCKLDNGGGVWDCNDERCDAENHYKWRGLCADNAPTGAESEVPYAE